MYVDDGTAEAVVYFKAGSAIDKKNFGRRKSGSGPGFWNKLKLACSFGPGPMRILFRSGRPRTY